MLTSTYADKYIHSSYSLHMEGRGQARSAWGVSELSTCPTGYRLDRYLPRWTVGKCLACLNLNGRDAVDNADVHANYKKIRSKTLEFCVQSSSFLSFFLFSASALPVSVSSVCISDPCPCPWPADRVCTYAMQGAYAGEENSNSSRKPERN